MIMPARAPDQSGWLGRLTTRERRRATAGEVGVAEVTGLREGARLA
jgi:hypothetical protein